MQTDSPQLAANLSRLAVETYVDSNYSVVANRLFKRAKKEQIDPDGFLEELEDSHYPLPRKTRDIYLYLPYRMLNIFPTVALFGNLDLGSGKKKRNLIFYPTRAISNKNGLLQFGNGLVFDTKKGVLFFGKKAQTVRQFIMTENQKNGKIALQVQNYHSGGSYSIVYMKSYGQFIVMDNQTLHSIYVQMFVLGKYDKHLFEPVVASPYSRIYKLKR
jgi:dolichyl-diphosphooligosaccharide--protein glycosyltransferase/undecaprenyl-diphosphooligosaccharide--protein glycosyltransferase